MRFFFLADQRGIICFPKNVPFDRFRCDLHFEITIGGEKNQNMQILTIGGLKSFGVMRGSKSGLTI